VPRPRNQRDAHHARREDDRSRQRVARRTLDDERTRGVRVRRHAAWTIAHRVGDCRRAFVRAWRRRVPDGTVGARCAPSLVPGGERRSLIAHNMNRTFKHLETKVVRAGEPSPRIEGAVVMPVFQSAMFEYAGETSYHDLKYIRLNNTPTHAALHLKLAAIEGGEAALVTASGMAAISTTLLTVLEPGDHLLAQDCLYGGTHDFLTTEFAKLGIETDFIDADDPASWEPLLRPRTRAIYVETLTNPLLQVPDLDAIVRFAEAHGLVSMIDNTFATPVNFRP